VKRGVFFSRATYDLTENTSRCMRCSVLKIETVLKKITFAAFFVIYLSFIFFKKKIPFDCHESTSRSLEGLTSFGL